MAVPGDDEIEKARTELKNLIPEKFRAPDLLRLAYASQFTIASSPPDDAGTKTTQSASNNNNNHKAEIAKIKANNPKITYPDLYQLAGTVALEELGVPILDFVPGRKDSSISPDERCLPDVEKSPSDLRGAFAKAKIYDTKHIVALCGGLKLARSGIQEPNLKFDNSYFVDLDKNKSSSPAGKNALLDDPDFYNFVHHYATYTEDFIKDYKEAHNKLSELGLPWSLIRSAMAKRTSLVNNTMGQKEKAVGVAVAAIVVILSVFYLINRRRAKHSPQQFQ